MPDTDILKFDIRKGLGMIEDYAKLARIALDDENEGNLTYYVTQLHGLAGQCAELCREW